MKMTNNGVSTNAKPLTESEKIEEIEFHFRKIMEALGLDMQDGNFHDTPRRVAEMYVEEIFSGLNTDNSPEMTTFQNTYRYNGMLIEKDITLYSYCAHHFVPITGRVHVGYFPAEKVVGLSKINRLVHYLARKPQVQEKLTREIVNELEDVLETKDVAVLIDADHLCVASRGVKDTNSKTQTSFFGGRFKELKVKQNFLESIKNI